MITAELATLAQSSQASTAQFLLVNKNTFHLYLRFVVRLKVSLNERVVALEIANFSQIFSQNRVHWAKHLSLQDLIDDIRHFVAGFRFLDLLLVVALAE